jgi:peptidoglycan/LPS O-acetylase OafA/YrhL
MVWLVLLLLLAAALGILGAIIKAALVVALGIVFAIVIIGAISYYYVRHRFRKFVKEAQAQQGVPPGQAGPATPPGQPGPYPTTGTKGPGPSLPPSSE